ncbi:hypothetical protein N9X63_07060 [Woeseiaceae bacterium]|jgi:deaminated glutathione amidase|nr:hypothetical protein [Woeseiaceae bacterium]MDB2544815.1 hypothetical protein [Woeseiaceae bacterium]|tara:strand:+ start:77 stop:1129 length:1053 start_codon:yes stop_codon:yes gene_type:complete
MTEETTHYMALCLQLNCPTINRLSVEESRKSMMKTIKKISFHLNGSKLLIGNDTRLVVLPEYFMTGYPLGESIQEWTEKAAIDIDGPEYDALSNIAQKNNVFLSGNAYEKDSEFPGLYFQTSFIINSSGDLILRYRRLISLYAPTPHDVWDRYLEVYGYDAIFPVANTEIGKLACCASEEILYPEICRAHTLRGAEIILHSSSEIASNDLTPKDITKRARAIENLIYVVSCNSGGIQNSPIPTNSVDGMSKIIDFHGNILASSSIGETMVSNAEIDLLALRRYRDRPGMSNILSRQRLELFGETYNTRSIYPANTLLDKKTGKFFIPERKHFSETQKQVIASLSKKNLNS